MYKGIYRVPYAFPQDIIGDHFAKLTVDDLKAAYRARAIALDQIMRVSGKHLDDDGAGSLTRAAEKLGQIALSRGTTSNATLLSNLVLSRLEEAQQLQHLVGVTDWRTGVSPRFDIPLFLLLFFLFSSLKT